MKQNGDVVTRLNQLKKEDHTNEEVAKILANEGYKTTRGKNITPAFINYILYRTPKRKTAGTTSRIKRRVQRRDDTVSPVSILEDPNLSSKQKIEILKILFST